MTTRRTGALAAGALAVGIVVGAAGTVLVHDATRSTMGMGDMQHMTMMGGGMMGGPADMPMRRVASAHHQGHHAGADR